LKKILKLFVILIAISAVIVGILRVACIFYPTEHKLTVEKYAQMYGIEEELVYAVIKAESNFDESAVSQKGAVGLMQIMESTGEWAAEKIGLNNYTKESLYNPEINIEIGCFYLSYLLDLYGNDVRCAVAAYNAGQANVDKWLGDEMYSKDGKSLDKIPFGETAKYVKKVMGNVKIYDFLY